MKIKDAITRLLITALLLLSACSQPSSANPEATIAAAVEATTTAGQNAQATVDAAVQATIQAQTAQQAAIEQAVQATLTVQPTPAYAEMSEAELAALIDQSVNQALAAYSATSSAVTQSTSDGTVSEAEVATTSTSITTVYYEIAYAEELIQAYYAYYGEYTEAALTTLNEMENELESISASLNEISAILTQGAASATAAINQLNAAVASAQTQAADLQTKVQGFQEQVKTGLGQRENDLLNLPATDLAQNEIGAINQAHDFLEAFKTALGDGKFSPAELNNIGQLAANARASLNQTGDPKLQKLGVSIEGLTRNAARGEWGQAQRGARDFEGSLPARRR